MVPGALRAIGEEVKVHDELFSPGLADRTWLRVAGEKKWIVLNEDSKLRYHRSEVMELLSARVRAFMLVNKNLTGAEMGRVFVKALPRIKKLCGLRPAPFIAHIHSDGTVMFVKSGQRKGLPGTAVVHPAGAINARYEPLETFGFAS